MLFLFMHCLIVTELSAEMEDEIDSALYPHPSNEILSDGFRLQISRKDMVTLSGLSWLNDEVFCEHEYPLFPTPQKELSCRNF